MRFFRAPIIVGIFGLMVGTVAEAGPIDFGTITPTQVNSVTSPTDTFQNSNGLTDLSNGNYVVTWLAMSTPLTNYEPGTTQFAIFNSQGQPVSGILTIDTDGFGVPNVAPTAGGGFAVEYETLNQVNVQFFDSTGSAITGQLDVPTNGHLGSIAPTSNGGVVVTWTNYGPVYAQVYNSTGTPVTGAVQVGSGGTAWRGSVVQVGANEYAVSWGNYVNQPASATLFDGNGSTIGSPISTGLSGNDVVVQALGNSYLLFDSFETSNQFSIFDISTSQLTTVSLNSNVSNFPEFLNLDGTNEFAAFYELNGTDQTYYDIFDFAGDLIQGPTLFSQIADASNPNGSAWFDLLTIQTGPDSFAFSWTTANGDLETGVTNLASVPEPATWTMMLASLFGIGFMARLWRKQAAKCGPLLRHKG